MTTTTTQSTTSNIACPPCDTDGPFLRNNYFTGKLLVERDFIDEQDYHAGKMRHHNARLHGSGVVCGLKVHQHPSEDCRKRYVCIEPGTAIDCCGREIVIPEQDVFGHQLAADKNGCGALVDLHEFEAIRQLIEDDPQGKHTIQIAVCYRECGTEDIPVLYDECGCDDTQCKPNRVLESYKVHVLIDPDIKPHSPGTAELKWNTTIGVTDPSHIIINESKNVMYIMTVDEANETSAIFVVSLVNQAVKACVTIPTTALALALSSDGGSLYTAVQKPGAPNDERELLVYDTDDLNASPSNQTLPDTHGSPIELATFVAHPERLYVMAPKAERFHIWSRTGADAITVANDSNLDTGASLTGMDLSSDASRLYAIQKSGANFQVVVINITDPTNPSNPGVLAPSFPGNLSARLSVVHTTADDLIVVLSGTPNRVYLIDPGNVPANATLVATANIDPAQKARDLVVGAGGQWAFVLTTDTATNQSTVRALNLHLLRNNVVEWSAPVQVGDNASSIAQSLNSKHLFVPYTGDPADQCDGGVAVVDVTDSGCCEIFWESIDGCPACDEECVVLATIENYQPGFTIANPQTINPPTIAEDQQAKTARINNRLGRKLLPSIQSMAKMLECICAHGDGGQGPVGPQGPPGLSGPPGEDGQNGVNGENGKNGTNGNDGDPGPGLEKGLTRITALSWVHDTIDDKSFIDVFLTNASSSDPPARGLVIGFTNPVEIQKKQSLNLNHIFTLNVPDLKRGGHGIPDIVCWCALVAQIIPVEPTFGGPNRIVSAKEAPSGLAPGLALIVSQDQYKYLQKEISQFFVQLDCSFVVDKKGCAVDGEFTRASFDTGDRPVGSDFGIQGGLFRSWFGIRKDDHHSGTSGHSGGSTDVNQPADISLSDNIPRDDSTGPDGITSIGTSTVSSDENTNNAIVNFAFRSSVTRDELLSYTGIGEARADKLLKHLTKKPIRNTEELRKALGMSKSKFTSFTKNNRENLPLK